MRLILVLPPVGLTRRLFSGEACRRLHALGEVRWNEGDSDYSSDQLAELLPGAEACITSWGSPAFTPEVLEHADSLKVISHAAGSVRWLVGPHVFQRGIAVCTAQPAMAISVAAMNVAMMEIMLRNVVNLASAIRTNLRWQVEGLAGPRELNGKTVGIIGASLIGRETIRFLSPFDVKVLIYDPYVTEEEARQLDADKVSLEELLRRSDVISVNAPLTEETKGMITSKHLKLIKDGAVLVNTARGAIIDHQGLLEELRTGRFSAALDVTDPEPLPDGHEMFGLENVVFTPHIAGGTPEMIARQGEAAIANLEAFFSGKPPNRLVTPEMFDTIA